MAQYLPKAVADPLSPFPLYHPALKAASQTGDFCPEMP